jgi:glycosyltransferase involved in cell wall biosynthesis
VPTRVLIVASGLKGLGGHDFAYTRSVAGALQERGAEVAVFTHKHAPLDLVRARGFHRVFSMGAYDFPPGNGGWRDLAYLYAQSVIYADELQRALWTQGAFDLVFCHTVSDFELIGWNRHLSRTRFAGRLAILERLTPGFGSSGPMRWIFHPYWRIKPHYLRSIRRRLGDRFLLLTDSERLSEDYGRVYRHRIVTLPIPLSLSRLRQRDATGASAAGEPLRIGYMGDPRESKGFSMLPVIARQVVTSTEGEIALVIQCALDDHVEEVSARARDELRELARTAGDRLTLIEDRLSDDRYVELFRSLDLVLLPYTHPHFVKATSNVFAEAAALGIPVVVPADTWMASELRRSGGGVEFPREDAAGLWTAVRQAVDRHRELASRAEAYAGLWRARHNAGAAVDLLLEASGITAIGDGNK